MTVTHLTRRAAANGGNSSTPSTDSSRHPTPDVEDSIARRTRRASSVSSDASSASSVASSRARSSGFVSGPSASTLAPRSTFLRKEASSVAESVESASSDSSSEEEGESESDSEADTDAISEEEDSETEEPEPVDFEFMGPHGTVLAVLGVPFAQFVLQLLCDPVKGFPPEEFYSAPIATIRDRLSHATLFSGTALTVIVGWLFFQAILHGFLPGTFIEGTPLPRSGNGRRLQYKVNALACLVATYLALFALFSAHGFAPFLWVADNMLPLATAASTVAITGSVLLYLMSHRVPETDEPVLLAAGADTGYPLYDFWMGRELNPRFGDFDFKYFCELRPGLIGWTVLNACLALKQYVTIGTLSDGMILVLLFQGYYVVDSLWNEASILTTMDLTTDGFGMMLCFGDLAWVPFTYSLQALYLAHNPSAALSRPVTLLVVVLELLGMYMFRAANSEKDAFRADPTDPAVRHLEFIHTERGTRLLVSGWWGLARHINYTGDWLMALSWCLTTGFGTPFTYFYAIYFGILLIHREHRDEQSCRKKYGADWEVYRQRVPARFIPGVW
ncbi:hypothetical protein HKX48_004956 [Thoreauomyces humboldtii]|nr:hypothetical protein HKX48_004956 [Thoreauomyces humboldtii]